MKVYEQNKAIYSWLTILLGLTMTKSLILLLKLPKEKADDRKEQPCVHPVKKRSKCHV
jgi:hypothetical protein